MRSIATGNNLIAEIFVQMEDYEKLLVAKYLFFFYEMFSDRQQVLNATRKGLSGHQLLEVVAEVVQKGYDSKTNNTIHGTVTTWYVSFFSL